MKCTLEHSRSNMMGAPEVLQLNQLLMRTLNAKKVIDVGVFTGMSTLSAALVIPDDGKVIACDVSEEFTNIGICVQDTILGLFKKKQNTLTTLNTP